MDLNFTTNASTNTAIQNLLGGDTITELEFVWMQNGETESAAMAAGRYQVTVNSSDFANFQTTAGMNVTASDVDLANGDTYQAAVRVTVNRTGVGTVVGPWTTGNTVTMSGVAAPAAPTGVSVSATSSSSVTINWNPEVAATTGFSAHYSISSSLTTSTSNGSSAYPGTNNASAGVVTAVAGASSAVITGLTAGTTYYVIVTASSANGTSSASSVASNATQTTTTTTTTTAFGVNTTGQILDIAATAGSGSTLTDSSANAFTIGNSGSFSWVADGTVNTNAIALTNSSSSTGTGNCFTISSDPSNKLSPATSSNVMTIMAWIKPETTSRGGYPSLFFGYNASVYFNFGLSPSMQLRAYLYDGTNLTLATGSTALTGGVWYQVAVVFNGTTTTLYVNGVQDGTATNSSFTGCNTSGGTYAILGTVTSPQNSLNGQAQAFRIFGRALSASELLSYFNAKVG